MLSLEPTSRQLAQWQAFKLRLAQVDLGEEYAAKVYDYVMYAIRAGRRLPTVGELRALARGTRFHVPTFTRALKEVLVGKPVQGAAVAAWWSTYRGAIILGGLMFGVTMVGVGVNRWLNENVRLGDGNWLLEEMGKALE